MFSIAAIQGFLIIFIGYICQTSILQYFFYYQQGTHPEKWKIQLKNTAPSHLNTFWGMPLFSSKPDRGPYHRFLVTLNLFVASCFAGLTCEASVRGWNKMTFESFPSLVDALITIVPQLLLAVVYESVVEYYWHRMMHLKFFYIRFHKMHHHYKSPEPWDDMYIHPLEAFGYYCILYGPPVLFSIHYMSFIAYMIIMGLCGVFDHSGIKIDLPFIYNTVDHDTHHAKFEVNYSFPFVFMDILHDTYDGEYAGKVYKPKIERKLN